jgi:hypothetical protein
MNGYTIRKPNEGRIRKRSSAMTESQDLDTHQWGAAARRCAVSRDGHRVCFRAASPEDLEPLRRRFARISPKSKYQRFFSPTPRCPGGRSSTRST